MPTEYLTPKEAAEVLHVTDETIRRWAKAGRLRHIKLPSGQRRFLRTDVEAFLKPIEPSEAAS